MNLTQAIRKLETLVGRKAGKFQGRSDYRPWVGYVAKISFDATPNWRVVITDGTPENDFRDACTTLGRSVGEITSGKLFLQAEEIILAATCEEIEAAQAALVN